MTASSGPSPGTLWGTSCVRDPMTILGEGGRDSVSHVSPNEPHTNESHSVPSVYIHMYVMYVFVWARDYYIACSELIIAIPIKAHQRIFFSKLCGYM